MVLAIRCDDRFISSGTTAQAIADYVALVGHLKQRYTAPHSPVVAFGGSYGGMLAGWARVVAPDTFTVRKKKKRRKKNVP